MRRISRLTLAFALCFAFFLLAPAFLAGTFALLPLIQTGGALDLVTPLVLLPLYWLLYRYSAQQPPASGETLLFVFAAALWSLGHGAHLAANEIAHHLPAAPPNDAYRITYFLDEQLSHYLWHSGIVALAGLIIARQLRHPLEGRRFALRIEIIAGVVYGFTFFAIVTEGRTAPLGVTAAAAFVVWGLVAARHRFRQTPLVGFFLAGHVVALLFFAIWFVRWKGLPEFSKIGIIAP